MTTPGHLRADLHVHSWHSTENGGLKFLHSRDCYSNPLDVYRTAKARGMDVVTITDHDSIDGCLELLAHLPGADDVIIGEEVSCWTPDSGIEVHLGVYGMTEALHRDIQPLRRNAFEVMAALKAAGVFFSLNHLLHFFRRQVPLDDYLKILDSVQALEVRNGTMIPAHNVLVERLVAHLRHSSTSAGRREPAITAGSDAHTLRRVGRTWTEAPARNATEFLEAVRNGFGTPGGDHGGTNAVAGDAYGVVARYYGSLVGLYPSNHSLVRRAGCIAFSAAAMAGQFLPWLIPALGKRRERAIVQEAFRHLEPRLEQRASLMAALNASQEQV